MGTAYTTESRYDTASRLMGTFRADPDGAGPLLRPAMRNTYNARGLLARVETGTLNNAPAENVAPALWPGFTALQQVDYTYDAWGRKLSQGTSAGGTPYALTQYSYDIFGRLECTAVRMNANAYSSLPASACSLGAQGAQGPDRITRQSYDNQDRVLQIQRGVGTSQQINYATYTYSAAFSMNRGPQETATDANGNKTLYAYDGLVRQTHWYFPSTSTTGVHSTTDFEQYGYDANGNRISLRKRDGRTINYNYDALNRVRSETYPAGTLPQVSYSFDLQNHQNAAVSSNGAALNWTYDGFSRLTSASSNQGGVTRTLTYPEYDAEGNRRRITHPDGQSFTYEYDGLNRMQRIRDGDGTEIIAIGYDTSGQRQALSRGGGVASTGYGYDPVNRLQTLSQNLVGTAYDETRTFAYNPASQVVSRTLNNAAYVFGQLSTVTTQYAVNGLNQYTQVNAGSPVAPIHDPNGNMTWDGTAVYSYDILNRLTNVSAPRSLNLAYDPKGRLFQTSGGNSGTTQFLYDGDALVAEYNGVGTMTRRYVHGPNVDEPLVWYDGASVSSFNRRYYHADHQRSVIASSDGGGNALHVNTYDPYGIPASGNTSRFQYTGQIMLPDIGLYHYKARIYNPTLGRFMQTDPVGYKDDLDLYTYVGDDPLNKIDPTGKVVDTIFDLAQIGYSVYKIATEGATRTNVLALGADVASALIPGVTGGGIAVRSAARAAETASVAKAVGVAEGAAAKGGVSLEKQAADLIPLNAGKSRVTLRSEGQKMEVDLAGRAHNGISTPHTKVSPRNTQAPDHQQPAYNTSEAKSTTRAATQEDIRTVRRYLERQ